MEASTNIQALLAQQQQEQHHAAAGAGVGAAASGAGGSGDEYEVRAVGPWALSSVVGWGRVASRWLCAGS